ncbi:MAG: phosphate signaling complex protein PhoU [Pseudomonadota bacterium]
MSATSNGNVTQSDHIVSRYDEELDNLAVRIAQMGGLAEQALTNAILALRKRDHELAEKVILTDQQIDNIEAEIEDLAIQMIARRQPMASDLREIMAANKISSDLERVGDLAKNVAKRVTVIREEYQPPKIILGIEHLSDIALQQLKDILDAYTRRDVALATDVWHRDRNLDAIYTSIFRELLTYMMEDPRSITLCTHLLFAAKNIERIGDHATNIAETVYYLVTGENMNAKRTKVDELSDAPVGAVIPGSKE